MRVNPYGSRRYLTEYLLFHFGRPADLCPVLSVPREWLRFHERIRKECLLPLRFPGPTRGLDIGCGVGRFTFELGNLVDEVVGIDSSRAFIQAARQMAVRQEMTILAPDSGSRLVRFRLALPESLRRSAVEFKAGDAADLDHYVEGQFQVVAAINLICRLRNPKRFLGGLQRVVAPGGQLVLASPFSWLTSYTQEKEWLTPEETERLLRPHFRMLRRRDLPFVIREHRRKFQLVVSQVMVFRRRGEGS